MGRTDEQLLRWAVENAGRRAARRMHRWGHVRDLLGFGSTSAIEICQRFGIDPDQEVGGCIECKESASPICHCNAVEHGFDPCTDPSCATCRGGEVG